MAISSPKNSMSVQLREQSLFGDFGVPEIEYFFDGLGFFFIFDGEWEFFVGGVDYAAGFFFPLGEEARHSLLISISK